MRLRKLIPSPRNAKERKEAQKRSDACSAHYREVERLGAMIHQLDSNRARMIQIAGTNDVDQTRAYLVDLQLRLADDLRQAGFPIEGTIKKEPTP